jgi:hypothetical protein
LFNEARQLKPETLRDFIGMGNGRRGSPSGAGFPGSSFYLNSFGLKKVLDKTGCFGE